MNYRHAFHAGNFADVMKHAILLQVLAAMTRSTEPLTVIDTHAGAGIYDLDGGQATRTREAEGGVRILMASDAPPVFDPLKAAVRRANRGDAVRYYPGSPLMIADALRVRDRLIACEMRADDHASLKAALPRQAGAEALREDGWRIARERAAAAARLLVLIDPPYEQAADAASAADLIAEITRAKPGATLALWAPIKDLEGLDSLVGRLEDLTDAPILLAQSRLRTLANPMTMNGSAMLVVNPPDGMLAVCRDIAAWVASALGETGALGKAEIL